MADVADVQDALVATIAQLIYPDGTAVASAVGVPVKIYAGWPQSSQLDADLAALATGQGAIHITVFPSGTSSNTTRFSPVMRVLSDVPATLSLTISGQSITIDGTVSTPQNVAVLVDAMAYAYAVQAGDSLTDIATALANQIPGASNVGPVISVPATSVIRAARAGGSGTMGSEVSREKQAMQLTVWADTPDHRKVAGALIKTAFDATSFMQMVDGTSARLRFQSSFMDDGSQRANLYRRDLVYSLEYGITEIFDATRIVVQQENIGVATGNTVHPTTTLYE